MISGIVTVILHPTSKIFPVLDFTFTLIFLLTNLLFVNMKWLDEKKLTPGFHQKLYARDARDFQWYQSQWKTDMRNRTL